MKKLKLTNMFYWCGVYLFNSNKKEYGGFNHFIARKIFKWKYTYMFISLTYKFGFENTFEDDEYWYDGYHNFYKFGFLDITYGT